MGNMKKSGGVYVQRIFTIKGRASDLKPSCLLQLRCRRTIYRVSSLLRGVVANTSAHLHVYDASRHCLLERSYHPLPARNDAGQILPLSKPVAPCRSTLDLAAAYSVVGDAILLHQS